MSDPLSVSDLFVFRVSQSMVATPLTPAEFADIARRDGWVKLEGIDVERVRRGAHLLYECIRPIGGPPRDLLNDTLDALDAMLDALTPEEET